MAKRLGKELNCPLVVCVNVEMGMDKKGEMELHDGLLAILTSMRGASK